MGKKKSPEQKKIDYNFGEVLAPLNDFQRTLVRERFLNPRKTEVQLGEQYGVKPQTISYHLRRPEVKAALIRMHTDIFESIKALQFKAIENMRGFLEIEPDGTLELYGSTQLKIKHQASKDLLARVLDMPAASPQGKRELPQFLIEE